MTFNKQRALFKAYDIRGETHLFDDDFIVALAGSFVAHYQRHHVKAMVVGHDTRPKSHAIAHAIAAALQNANIVVHWLGLVTTPLMVYWANQFDGSGVIATASHSPKNISGVKWLTHHQSPSPDDIVWLYQHLPKAITPIASYAFKDPKSDLVQRYANALHAIVQQQTTQKLANTLVIDCLDGASSVVVRAVFSPLVHRLIVLNDCTDGQFLKGNPDPSEPQRLDELSQAVIAHQADMGLAFDGDGDRLAVVDSTGQVLGFDELLCLLAVSSLNAQSHGKVLFDVKCVHTLPKLLHTYSQGKLSASMTKTGSSHLRRQAISEKALFAGELSGHFIFNDGQFTGHDDGVYAAIRLLLWLATQRQSLHHIYHAMPKPIATPDLYIQPPAVLTDNHRVHDWVSALCDFCTKHHQNHSTVTTTTIDGIRLDYHKDGVAYAFALMRASNTSSSLTVRFAGDTLADFNEAVDDFIRLLSRFAQKNHQTTLNDFILSLKTTIKNSITC